MNQPNTFAERALALVGGARVLGLGTGRAAERFIRALAEAKRPVSCVPTSQQSMTLALLLGLKVVPLQPVDITFDGADEVDPSLNLIKGYGGALWREKIVARASKRVVILVGEEKLVQTLGERGRVPVEVLPFAVPLVAEALSKYSPVLRQKDDRDFLSDNGNHILDCTPPNPLLPAFDTECRALDGVVATGCFFSIATQVLVERKDSVELLERKT